MLRLAAFSVVTSQDPAPRSATAAITWPRLLVVAACLCVLVRSLSVAFVAEDAFITLRTLDNFLNGFGLRWNADERVQTFTHPLWALVALPFYALTRDVVATFVPLGLLCAILAFAVVAYPYRARPVVLIGWLLGPWLSSEALLRYATSGLENPLTLLLLALFAHELLRTQGCPLRWGRTVLWAALGMTNRLDVALMVAPALAWLFSLHWRTLPWRRVLLGLAPLLIWLAFSLFYYGFLWPNTAYAKLAGGISRLTYLRQGLHYVSEFVVYDPICAMALVLSLGVTLVDVRRAVRGEQDKPAALRASLGIGAWSYVLYTVWIGGDFLAGRFFAAPAMLALVLLAAAARSRMERRPVSARAVRWSVVALVAMLAVNTAARRGGSRPRHHVVPYPMARLSFTSDLGWRSSSLMTRLSRLGSHFRERARRGGDPVVMVGTVGVIGYRAGSEVFLVDDFGLGDPLLARLRPACPGTFQPGHVRRATPQGYRETRRTGSTAFLDGTLARYYEKLRIVTREPLWSSERLATVLGFLVGRYDVWLEEYERERPPTCRPKQPWEQEPVPFAW